MTKHSMDLVSKSMEIKPDGLSSRNDRSSPSTSSDDDEVGAHLLHDGNRYYNGFLEEKNYITENQVVIEKQPHPIKWEVVQFTEAVGEFDAALKGDPNNTIQIIDDDEDEDNVNIGIKFTSQRNSQRQVSFLKVSASFSSIREHEIERINSPLMKTESGTYHIPHAVIPPQLSRQRKVCGSYGSSGKAFLDKLPYDYNLAPATAKQLDFVQKSIKSNPSEIVKRGITRGNYWKNTLVSFMSIIIVRNFSISTITGIESSKNKLWNPNNKVNTAIDNHGIQFGDDKNKVNQRVLLKQHRQQEQQLQKQQNVWYDESIDRFARTVIENTYQRHMEYDESYFDYNNSTIRSIDVQCDAIDYIGFEGSEPPTEGQFPYYDSKTEDSSNNSTFEGGDLIVLDGKHVYAAYGKYLVVLNLSNGKIVRTVEVPKNNITTPFYCGTGRYNEDIMWTPYAKIVSLLLHNDRLVVIVSGYFEDNDGDNRIDRTITAYNSTLVQIYDTSILDQTNSSYIGMLSSNFINGDFKYARSIQNTTFIVTQSLLITELALESPFHRYDETNIELTDDEYTMLVRSKTDEQTELFQQMLYRDLTSENHPLPTIANINISLYDKSFTEEKASQCILESNHLLFVHSIDMMIKQSKGLAVKKLVGILVQDNNIHGSDNIIIVSSYLPFSGPCPKSLIHAIQFVHNSSTPTETTISVAVVPGYTSGSTNIFQKTLLRVAVDFACLEQSSNTSYNIPSNIPSSVPFVVPNNIPSSNITSDFLSDVPSVAPIYVPSDIPSKIPSTIPSDIPSIVPSDAPSEIPSTVPSDIPSSIPSIATSIQTSVIYKKYIIIWNITSNEVDFLKKDKRPGNMEEVSRIEFEHDSLQFFENAVYGLTYLVPMIAYTYYDFTDPYLPKSYTKFAFNWYGFYLYPLYDDQRYGNNSNIILVMGLDFDTNHINMIDMSNPRNPVSLHNFSVPFRLIKTDNGQEYQEAITWSYEDSRYNNDGLFFMPITVDSDYVYKTIRKHGYMVFSINKEDGIKEVNQCQMFVGETEVYYSNLQKLDKNAQDEKKCYYCYGPSIRKRSMRYDDGKKWLITGSNFAMINIDNIDNNAMTSCDKVWDEKIDIPAPDDHWDCCTDLESDPFYEYCCR